MITPNFYKQTDKKWQGYSWNGATVARNGCGPSSVANIVSVLPVLGHPKATPLSVFKVACKKGYMHPQYGTYYAGMTQLLKDYGVKKLIHTSDMAVLKKHLEAGDMAVCLCGKSIFTSSGHYVAAYGIKGSTAYVSDSASTAKSRHYPSWTTLKNAILAHPYPQCWIIDNTAQYLGAYKIRFKARGGSGKMDVKTMYLNKASKLPKNVFERPGFKFVGWSVGKSDYVNMKRLQIGKVDLKNKESVKNIAKPGKTVTLYACWKGCGPEAAAWWARKIASDNSFMYGDDNHKNWYHGRDRASQVGCYFCGTTRTGPKQAQKGSKWEKTYCCNSFAMASYVHGMGLLSKCPGGSVRAEYWTGLKKNGKPLFEKIGTDLKYSQLRKGDLLCCNKHIIEFTGKSKIKGFYLITHAAGKGWTNKSIRTQRVKGRIGKDYTVVRCIL
ncbi:MAG: C39 family peptidase [Lachnospiraceae bacterium]|nr:C39 family peptidase [Lachnospiraceae bacterium]